MATTQDAGRRRSALRALPGLWRLALPRADLTVLEAADGGPSCTLNPVTLIFLV